jgi:hypothetical protein
VRNVLVSRVIGNSLVCFLLCSLLCNLDRHDSQTEVPPSGINFSLFKPAPDDPLIFMCPDSADAIKQIQSVLQRQGVKEKHTNAAAQRAVNEVLQIIQEIQAKERALEYKP